MKFEEVLTMLTLVADEPFASAAVICGTLSTSNYDLESGDRTRKQSPHLAAAAELN